LTDTPTERDAEGPWAMLRRRKAYNERDYHQTTDEFDPRWTFACTAQEATVAYELGRSIANDGSWPGWYPGIEYGAVRAENEAECAAKQALASKACWPRSRGKPFDRGDTSQVS
jgi:hypothetical protein